MDPIGSAKWLDKMRVAATADWVDRYHRWRSDRTSASVASPELAVLSLVVDTLVIDPVVWRTWDGGDRQMDVFLDARDNAWIRMPLPARNTRLYPLRRDLAERLAGISRDGWKALKLEAVAELARSLMSPWYGVAGSPDFWQLLNRVQSGCAARMPGIALGYADGSQSVRAVT